MTSRNRIQGVSRPWVVLACAAALGAGGWGPMAAGDEKADVDQYKPAVTKALSLRDCDLVRIDTGKGTDLPVRVKASIGGATRTLNLVPHSVRAPNFQLLEQRADGKIYPVKAPPETTFRGTVDDLPGSLVAGGIMPEGPDQGLHATVILPDGTRHWIQPAWPWVPGAPGDLHTVYTADDVIRGPWRCGNTDDDRDAPATPAGSGPALANRGATLYTAQVSIDADFEYFARYGGVGGVNSRVALIWNIVNVQYEREVDIKTLILTILVRSAEPDPYTTTDSSFLLTQFRDEWNNNQPLLVGDLNHLFTGKEIDGTTVGRAFIADVCTTDSYGFVQSDFNNNLMSATDLTAHESGHNWGANHCTCDGISSTLSTMNATMTSINRFTFSNDIDNVAEIRTYRNTRPCLVTGSGGIDPPNDACANAVPIGPNTLIGWNNAGATTDGGTSCSSGADIWYTYTPACDSTVTINTCGSNHDTTLGVFTGACGSLVLLTCNDDFSPCGGTGRQSQVTFAATRGTVYRVRLGGYLSATGDGLLIVSQFCPPPSNDRCSNATIVGQGSTPFSNVAANTDGPLETTLCTAFGNAQVLNDVWFRYVAPCSGVVRASTCGTGFDTKMAAYQVCPFLNNTAIACNDDAGPACGGLAASVEFNTTAGFGYTIRIGGFNGQVGTGVLNITSLACPPGACCCGSSCSVITSGACALLGGAFQGGGAACNPPGNNLAPCCRADYNHSGGLSVQDLFDFLAGYFGGSACADANQSGSVSVQDIFDYLAEYFTGGC